MARSEKDIEDACPFPPGVDIPRKSGLGTILSSVLVVDWRVIAPILSLGVILLVSGLLIAPPIPFTSLKEPKTWNSTIPPYKASFFPELTGWVPMYSKQVVHNGDLTLEGGEKYLIENCTYILNGTFHASGNSSLVFRNSELWVRGRSSSPPVGDLNFTDTSTLSVYNSTIVGPTHGYGVTVILLGDSVVDVKYSNVTFVDFNGDDRSRIQIDHSTAGAIYVATNASCSIQNSDVDMVGPGGRIWGIDPSAPWMNALRRVFPWMNTRVEAFNSSIKQLSVRALGSRIVVNGSITKDPNWSPSMFCSGGMWFNVSVLNSSIDTVLLSAKNSTVTVENNGDLNYLEAVNGVVNVENSSIPILQLNNCHSSVDDSVFRGIAILGDSNALIRDSLTDTLGFYDLTGMVECDGLMARRLFGDNINATIIGGLKVLEKRGDNTLFRFSRLNRGYQIFAESSGVAIRDVTLTLRDGNDTVWSGKSDGSGQASFYVTYYNLWKLGPMIWADDNMASTLTLTATSGDRQQVRNVTAESDTPIIFSFEKAPEPPIWGNRYALLITGALMIAATSGYTFLKRKRLRGDPK
jgi:hypothetical protein